ncbi:hypothetical protein LWI28_002429 [Acer negundo]|uniref:Fe2OG dioxygenase domain-containing protein n=1 Tax=Acer negundo TaxID=4023 RepID=A0AAD5IBP1_ACENE|nr:hypothetical protein LWI28_002429 [Acer negundo]
MAAATVNSTESYDRSRDIKQFEDTKTGVKGLVDSGITTIPRFFIHPPDKLSDLSPNSTTRPGSDVIPTIDLSGVNDSDLRSTIVEKVTCASRELGFFQITNHGIEEELLESVIGAIKGFHEQPADIKKRVYSRDDMKRSVSFFSNMDLFHSKAANWVDTLQIKLGPTLLELDEIPEIYRKQVMEWNEKVRKLGELLMGVLCEGLGVDKGKLKELTFTEGRMMAGNYYPYCPQPHLTMGIVSHTDAGVLTILLQDQTGGLQVKYHDEWVDVKPIPGALVINIGDLLQILSNDEYKSVEHRVLANSFSEPRISIAVFFSTIYGNNLYGPFPELVSQEKPALFTHFKFTDYIRRFLTKELDGRSLTNYYRL